MKFKKSSVGVLTGGLMSLVLSAVTHAATVIPPGAAALGYNTCVIDEHPVAADISPGTNGKYKWFSGAVWGGQTPLSHYTTTNGVLTLSLGGGIIGTPFDSSPGALPTLLGSKGFYIEFDAWLSDNDPDHWPALWVMPMEHDGGSYNSTVGDVYPGDPAGFERWMELDVDEGGFDSGTCNSVISWSGIYPNYVRNLKNNANPTAPALDRTKKHTFGASYDPVHSQVTWWLDGVQVYQVNDSSVPAIASKQHFYPIIGCQTHGANKPYSMYVSGVRAYVP
jgi:hypothetical protein